MDIIWQHGLGQAVWQMSTMIPVNSENTTTVQVSSMNLTAPSTNHNTSGEYIYVVLTAITAVLSILGGTAIAALHFAFNDLRRSSGRRLLLNLAISDSLLALGNLLGVIWYLYRDSVVINRSEVYCDFQSAMTIYFSITSFSWTVIMAVCIFTTVVLGRLRFTSSNMKLFHVVSWLPGGVIVIVAVSYDVLGTDMTLESASWCWINPATDNVLLWQFMTGKAFEIVAYITTCVLYLSVKIYLQRQTKKELRMSTRRRSRKEIIGEANRKLTFVPLVFIVCRIWGTVRFLIGNFAHDIVNEPYVTWINPLQGIGDSAQGFANFVLYCYCTDSIRRRIKMNLLKMYNKKSQNTNNSLEIGECSISSVGSSLSTLHSSDRRTTATIEVYSVNYETGKEVQAEVQDSVEFAGHDNIGFTPHCEKTDSVQYETAIEEQAEAPDSVCYKTGKEGQTEVQDDNEFADEDNIAFTPQCEKPSTAQCETNNELQAEVPNSVEFASHGIEDSTPKIENVNYGKKQEAQTEIQDDNELAGINNIAFTPQCERCERL